MKLKNLGMLTLIALGAACGAEQEAQSFDQDPAAATPGQAEQGLINSDSLLRNDGTGLCLDGFAGVGGRPYQYTCNGANGYQRWRMQVLSSITGVFYGRVINSGSQLCLDVINGVPTNNYCNDSKTQRWFYFFNQYNLRLQNEATQTCLDGFGNQPYLYSCNTGNAYQSWREQ